MANALCRAFGRGLTFIGVSAVLAAGAGAADFNVGDAHLAARATLTLGTALRADGRDPELLPAVNAAAIGASGHAVGGRNSDDGNLNFDRGDAVSTVLKAVAELDAKRENLGAFLRVKGWYDYALEEQGHAWGNVGNGYVAGQPLSDRGFPPRARFSGVALQEAYAYGSFTPGGLPLYVRLGNQLVPWGDRVTIPGGFAAINPVDAPAVRRPGALPDETRIPFAAAFARLGVTDQLNVEAYYQIKFEPTVLDGCGTFFASTDYVPEGCDKVFVGATTDPVALASGLFIQRTATQDPSNAGQLGVGATYKADALRTDFGAFFAQYHNRAPVIEVTKSTRNGAPFIPGNPGGMNVTYFTTYPERVRVYGLNFVTRLPAWTISGELTYRPNQPFSLNSTDLLNAFASNTAPSLLRDDASATPLGAVYHGYDRRELTQAQVAVVKPLGALLGAASVTLAGEVAFRYVNDLPDVTQRRYGRSDIYGLGPINGTCSPPATPKQCSTEGFASKTAWGYRLRAALVYPNVADGLDVLPTFTFAHDVKGWAVDGAFLEDRQLAAVSLRAEYRKQYTAEIAYVPTWGGGYNNLKDRSVVAFSMGARF